MQKKKSGDEEFWGSPEIRTAVCLLKKYLERKAQWATTWKRTAPSSLHGFCRWNPMEAREIFFFMHSLCSLLSFPAFFLMTSSSLRQYLPPHRSSLRHLFPHPTSPSSCSFPCALAYCILFSRSLPTYRYRVVGKAICPYQVQVGLELLQRKIFLAKNFLGHRLQVHGIRDDSRIAVCFLVCYRL